MCFGSGVTFSEAVVLAVGAGVIGVFVAANIRLEPLRQSPGVATTWPSLSRRSRAASKAAETTYIQDRDGRWQGRRQTEQYSKQPQSK